MEEIRFELNIKKTNKILEKSAILYNKCYQISDCYFENEDNSEELK